MKMVDEFTAHLERGLSRGTPSNQAYANEQREASVTPLKQWCFSTYEEAQRYGDRECLDGNGYGFTIDKRRVTERHAYELMASGYYYEVAPVYGKRKLRALTEEDNS